MYSLFNPEHYASQRRGTRARAASLTFAGVHKKPDSVICNFRLPEALFFAGTDGDHSACRPSSEDSMTDGILHKRLDAERRDRKPIRLYVVANLQLPAKAHLLDIDIGLDLIKLLVEGDETPISDGLDAAFQVEGQISYQAGSIPGMFQQNLLDGTERIAKEMRHRKTEAGSHLVFLPFRLHLLKPFLLPFLIRQIIDHTKCHNIPRQGFLI